MSFVKIVLVTGKFLIEKMKFYPHFLHIFLFGKILAKEMATKISWVLKVFVNFGPLKCMLSEFRSSGAVG